MQKVYTLGYTGRTIEELQGIVTRLHGTLFDIRFVPRSRVPHWNQGPLIRRFGPRYQHLKTFGNENYKGNSIVICDFESGVTTLSNWSTPAILMCVCADPLSCHRTVVGRMLTERGFSVQELSRQASIAFA